MKLIEIKNNLAKLEYSPVDFPLVLSDFLTVDDGNQKVIAQVVSIESCSDEFNRAVIKFSLDLNSDNTFVAYSGYVPTIDALVSKTQKSVIESIFSANDNSITLGQLTSSSNLNLKLNTSLMDNFLYVQSDRIDERNSFFKKIMDLNNILDKKTLFVDFDGDYIHNDAEKIVLGRDFKLPIDNVVLNYIYENDLNGLTIEQKTIVQDIILEIQDYISTLDSGYIPFDTLLNVVNDIYESDKSTGVILLRNKLIKYSQLGIFASNDSEILSLNKSLETNTLIILSMPKIDFNWQLEALSFLTLNLDDVDFYLIFNVKDEAFSKDVLGDIFRAKNIHSIISSKYDSEFAPILKSYARNLVLFKPLTQQKAFATYNSFFNKLADKEFIISGESTYYTPLILRELAEKFEYISTISSVSSVKVVDNSISSIANNDDIDSNSDLDSDVIIDVENDSEIEELNSEDIEAVLTDDILENQEDSESLIIPDENDLIDENLDSNTFQPDETLELEIANDVDKMFFAEAAIQEKDEFSVSVIDDKIDEQEDVVLIDDEPSVDYNDMFSDDDLDLLDENFSNDVEFVENNASEEKIDATITIDVDDDSATEAIDLELDDSLPGLSVDTTETTTDNNDFEFYDTNVIDNFPVVDEPIDNIVSDVDDLPILNSGNGLLGVQDSDIAVYKTELDDKIKDNNTIKIAEGNIVYHPKYGRGVVEQMVNYGNKSFCSILFDNLGRRLLDPNLADLKQV